VMVGEARPRQLRGRTGEGCSRLRSDTPAAANNDDFHFLVHAFDLSVLVRLAGPQPLRLREMMCYFFLQLPESRISKITNFLSKRRKGNN
jgi:hypothetical protein